MLALQGAFARHIEAFERIGVDASEIRRPDQLHGVDGLVIPGGESTTMSNLMKTFEFVEPLGKLLAEGLPTFGTCAGMILLASEVSDGRADQVCFGAIDIGVRRNGYGRQVDSFEARLEIAAIDKGDQDADAMTGVFIRAPVVERVGSGVEVLATLAHAQPSSNPHRTTTGDVCEANSGSNEVRYVEENPVLCRQDDILVSSFHPELTGDDRLHELFASSVSA